MALSGTVTGDGRVISKSVEPGGTYSYTAQSVDEAADGSAEAVQVLVTVVYTETRETRKWYALTLAAIEAYITANPTAAVSADCVNEYLEAYEMTVSTVTRTISSVTATTVPTGE